MKKLTLEINGILFDELTVAENYQDMVEGQEKKTHINDLEGMVYVFNEDMSRDFVNENPHLSFDVIMVNSNEIVTAVHTMKKTIVTGKETGEGNSKEKTEYLSPSPYRYVFELKSGTAKKLRIKPGDRLNVDFIKILPYQNAINIRYAFQLKSVELNDRWQEATLQNLKRIVETPDTLRRINLDFVGAKFNQNAMLTDGWFLLNDIDTEKSGNVWLQKSFQLNKKKVFARLCLSVKGHFRYLYLLPLSTDGSYSSETTEDYEDTVCQQLHQEFAHVQEEPRPASIDMERENIVWDLTNPSVSDDWSEDQKKFYIWSKELFRLKEKSKYYVYRLLNGMLRFGRFCDYDFVLGEALIAAADLDYRWGMAQLATISLTRDSESDNAFFWNSVGYVLDRLGEKTAAFYCFAKAWNCKFAPLYANNLWLMGNTIIPEMLKKQEWNELFPVASMMLSAISSEATVKQQVEVMCMVGLIYEVKNDFEEAEQYYEAAYDIYKRKQAKGKTLFSLRSDFPILYQSLMRNRMTDTSARRVYANEQLKTFPHTPLEVGFEKRISLEFIEGDGHGDHWDSVTKDAINDPEKFFSIMIQEGKRDSGDIEIPFFERGDGLFKKGHGFSYDAKDDSTSPIESYFLLGEPEKSDSHVFASAFPVFKKGYGCSVVRSIRGINVWSNAIEASVEFDLRKNGNTTLAFFLPDYCGKFAKLEQNTAYRIEIGAFAYFVERFEEQEIKIDKGPMLAEEKLRLRKEGKDDNIDSVSIHMASDLCIISRAFTGCRDDVSMTAPIEKIEKFNFLGNPCLVLWLKFDSRGANITLPVFLRAGKVAESYIPHVGDVVNCTCWLQGWIHESHGSDAILELSNECAGEEQEDDDDDFDFANALLGGVRGTEQDLAGMITNALTQKALATDIHLCLEPLPGDPDLSCKINGEIQFVKVMTGYFETEDECRKAWHTFKKQVPSIPGMKQTKLLSIVGIKLCDDQYKIYYNGFYQWDPVHDHEKDELKLDFEYDVEDRPEIIEKEMAAAIAKCWNDLDCTGIRQILADDFEYTSQWVFDTIHGADKYLEYLSGKFNTLKNGSKPTITAVRSNSSSIELDMEQTSKSETFHTMLQFDIANGKLSKACMCDPSFRRLPEDGPQGAETH